MAVHVTFRNVHDEDGNVKRCLGGLLNLRNELAQHVSDTATFEPELTDEGILFRYVGEAPRPRQRRSDGPAAPPPAWAAKGE